jgi:hypothetical protein
VAAAAAGREETRENDAKSTTRKKNPFIHPINPEWINEWIFWCLLEEGLIAIIATKSLDSETHHYYRYCSTISSAATLI